MTQVYIFTENLDLFYEKGVLMINYIYQGVLQIVTSVNF
jgi:hypothetical protein